MLRRLFHFLSTKGYILDLAFLELSTLKIFTIQLCVLSSRCDLAIDQTFASSKANFETSKWWVDNVPVNFKVPRKRPFKIFDELTIVRGLKFNFGSGCSVTEMFSRFRIRYCVLPSEGDLPRPPDLPVWNAVTPLFGRQIMNPMANALTYLPLLEACPGCNCFGAHSPF